MMDAISAIHSTFKQWKEKVNKMSNEMSCVNLLTVEELCKLNEQGFEFVVEDGVISDVLHG